MHDQLAPPRRYIDGMNFPIDPDAEPDPFAGLESDEGRATPASTRQAFLDRASRGYATIRRSFLWTADKGPGPLCRLITTRTTVPLDLFLLRIALQSVVGVEGLSMPIWARMLGQEEAAVTESVVTRSLKRLESLGLAAPVDTGNSSGIELRRENGSDEPYEVPTGTSNDPYFSLPFDYWLPPTPGKPAPFTELAAPGKAVLLILLSETQGRPATSATVDNIVDRYGISRSTGERGLAQLIRAGMVRVHVQRKSSHERPNGLVYIHHRALVTPFSTANRELLRNIANDAQKKKKGKGGGTGESAAT